MKLFKIISKLIFHRRGIFVVTLFTCCHWFPLLHFYLTNVKFIVYDFKNILVTPMSDPSVEQSDQCAAPDSPHSK